MHVGLLRLTLRLPENHSLKGKRQVVKSLTARLQNTLHLAAAEVDQHDVWQIAVIGIACVSTTAVHAEQQLDAALRHIEDTRPDLEVVEVETDIFSTF